MTKNYRAKCPECGASVELDYYNEVGDEITCHDCGSMLEVRRMDPPRLGVVKRSDVSFKDYLDDDETDDDVEDVDVDEIDDYMDYGDNEEWE